MPLVVQCPNAACRASCSVAEAGRPVKCPRCNMPFVARPTLDGRAAETKRSQPASAGNPFPVLPAEFGRYRVLKLLGQGGMGAVYLADDTQLRRQVALKLPFIEGANSAQRADRFIREAQSAAALHHPNICTVFDAGQIDGRPFLTMAYIPGSPLAEEIDPDAPMPQRRAAEIVRKVALALEHAHGKGTVHRDLKPANVMMTADGEPVVMDFGLAKRVADVDPGEAKLTRIGGIIGTPSYMSPEQAKGEAIGPATDVYSLGVMLFEMLTGHTPYSGPLAVVMHQIIAAPVPSVKEFRADVDSRLDAVCRRAMAKDAGERFPSMAEFAKALAKCATAPAPPPLPVPVAVQAHRPPSPKVDRSPFDGLDTAIAPNPAPRKAKANAASAPPPKKAKAGRGRTLVLVALALLALVTLGGWLATVLLRVETANGTLLVEIDDPDVEARIKGGTLILTGPDGEVKYKLTAKDRSKKVQAGRYEIHVEGADGLALDTSEFTLKKGGKVTVRVALEPEGGGKKAPREGGRVPVAAPDDDTAAFLRPSNWEGRDDVWNLTGGTVVGETKEDLKYNTYLCSKSKYSDFELTFRVRLKDGFGNSGVQIRSQVFHAGLFMVRGPQADIGMGYWGSLYGEGVGGIMRAADPVKIGKAVDESGFNVFRIVAKGTRITVEVNGLTMVDDFFTKLPDGQPASTDGIIAFQAHAGYAGMRVEFEDIKFKDLSKRPEVKAFTPLFNGKDLTGWTSQRGGTGDWKVVNGAMTCTGPRDHLLTDRSDIGDFHLRAEVKINGRGNSGIYFRAGDPLDIGDDYEAQICTTPDQQNTGSLYNLVRVQEILVEPNTWFTYEIIAQAGRIELRVNGKETATYDEVRPNRRLTGHIGMQHLAPDTEVFFRKIEIKVPSEDKAKAAKANKRAEEEDAMIAKLQRLLLIHSWYYRDSLLPPGGDCRFNADGTFHIWKWKYWVVGPKAIRVHYDRKNDDEETRILFTFDEELTQFAGKFTDTNGKVHEITGTRQDE